MSIEREIVVYGVRFKWEVTNRGGTVVRVSNPVYGTVERRTEFAITPEDLARHMATELVRHRRKT